MMRPTAQAAALALCGAVLFTGMIAAGCGRRPENETVPPSHEITVPNGGFEEGTAMWSVAYGTGTDDLSLSESKTYKFTASTDSHSGKKAALLSVRGRLLCLATTNAPDYVPIDQSGTYTLSAALRIEERTGSVSSVYMGVRKGSNGDFPETRVGEKTIPPGKDDYREYLLEDLDLTANDRVIIEIGMQNDAEGESQLYIDDVKLYVPQAASGTPETSTTITAPSASVNKPSTPAGTSPTVPEGFPAIGIPSDAKVTKASGSKETGSYLVIYYSKKPVRDVLQGHADALAKLGYTDIRQDLMSSDDGGVMMSIVAMNGTSAWNIRGGGTPGGDNGYWVQLNRLAGG